MATNSIVALDLFQSGKLLEGGWSDYSAERTTVVGCSYMMYAYSYNVTILRFTTPKFTGVTESLKLTIKVNYGEVTNPTYRYALCTSDANKEKYAATISDVLDDNQLASGLFKMSGVKSNTATNQTLTIPVTQLKENTTYYIILWGYSTDDSTVEVMEATNHSIIIYYNSGLVHIHNGTNFEAYHCYIDNGTSWDLCIPYIDNGTSWDICS